MQQVDGNFLKQVEEVQMKMRTNVYVQTNIETVSGLNKKSSYNFFSQGTVLFKNNRERFRDAFP